MDKNDKKHDDKLTKKKKLDKNNPKIKKPQIAGIAADATPTPGKTKKTY